MKKCKRSKRGGGVQRSNRHPRDEISPSESRLYLSLILPGEEEGKKKKRSSGIKSSWNRQTTRLRAFQSDKSVLPSSSIHSSHRWTDARHSKKGEGHKSRQLKKSCWLFKTSTPTQTEMKILYRGETFEYLLTFSFLLSSVLFLFFYIFFSRSPLSPPFSFSGIFLEGKGEGRGSVNLFAKSSRWNARGAREKIEKNDSMEEHATHSEWRAVRLCPRILPPPPPWTDQFPLPNEFIFILCLNSQLLFDLWEARNRVERLNIDSSGEKPCLIRETELCTSIEMLTT